MWCHSNGQSTPTYVNPVWNTSTTTCTTCHGGKTTITSGKHAEHVNAAANGGNFGCAQCHNKTVSSDTAISNYANHVSGTRDVYFTAFNGYTGALTATKTCRNNYCHSSGQATPAFLTAAAWNGATTYTCDSCHGAEGATLVAGAPEYTNVTTAGSNSNNSHYVTGHVSAAADCFRCHANTVASNGTLLTNGKHIDGFRNISFTLGGTYTAGTKTCTNTAAACHGTSTMRWGGTANCETCHGVTTADVSNYTYNNGTKSVVNMDQYTSVGHGKVTGNYRYSGSTGAANSSKGARQVASCETCHDAAVTHNTAGNYFRLKNANVDTMCTTALGCHSVTTTAHHNKTNTGGNAAWEFTPKCVDCHDPHGDNGPNGRHNNYMIQGMVNYSTASSTDGIPTFTKAVNFPANVNQPANVNWTSYVRSNFTGLCQICHSPGTNPAHYNKNTYETGHNNNAKCKDCHTHATGFQGAGGGDCLDCHMAGGSPTNSGRRDIVASFAKKSHHVKATTVSSRTCAMCHAEANVDGSMNSAYHNTAGKAVVLNVWNSAFTQGTGIAALMAGRSFVRYTSGYGSSAGMAVSNATRLNAVCLSCHNRVNADSTPFRSSGDLAKPTAYAWTSNTSIEARYNAAGTTTYSKYSPTTNNVVPQVNKSYSPHGNPDANQRDVAKVRNWADDKTATQPQVACFDCHNSHGSRVGSFNTKALTSYSSAVGGYKGGIMKEYTTSSSSYTIKKYMPTELTTGKPYSASSAACFDCHLGDNANAPKKMTSFNNKSSIEGYYDAGRWQVADRWVGSFAYKSISTATAGNGKNKNGRQAGGHFGASSNLTNAASKTIDGRCVVCHDPHGVVPSTSNAAYRLPALKGTWMTSPYKEDAAATQGSVNDTNAQGSRWNVARTFRPARFTPRFNYNNPPIVGGGYGGGTANSDWSNGGTGGYGYYIDDNTFGTTTTFATSGTAIHDVATSRKGVYFKYTNWSTASGFGSNVVKRITQNDTQFGGLCLSCHSKTNLQALTYSNGTSTAIHVHNTVKGWSKRANASDLFRNWQANMHNMHSYQTGTDTTLNCTGYPGDDGSHMPVGYRWGVINGNRNTTTAKTVQPPTAVASTQSTRNFMQNGYHQFPCSKCHTAHTSKLPRLMKTNCLDVGPSINTVKHPNGATYTYPVCDSGSPVGTGRWYMTQCHNMKQENTTNGGGWNTKTGW
jgi:predicted CxxxxCH...CXXCH cytochrome family protein